MIDLHSHILPGVDDGADVIEESLAMIELAMEGGTSSIVVTPHSNQEGRFENFCSKELIDAFDSLEQSVKKQHLSIQLYRGMEIMASEDVPEKIKSGQLISLNKTRYYLIEFPFEDEPERMGDILESVLQMGKIPLIAHPERYECIGRHPEILFEWMDMGCCAQVNKGSLLGRFGSRVAKTAQVLMEHELVTCVASDAHTSVVRTPFMADVKEVMEEKYGYHYAKKLLHDNPKAILEDREISFTGYPPVRRKWSFWL